MNKNNLTKKPKKGGTPAKENKKTVNVNIKKLLKLNILKEYRVFNNFPKVDNIDQKIPITVRL